MAFRLWLFHESFIFSLLEAFCMIFVGIDVAKDKHDLCALDSNGVALCDSFSFPNSLDGFSSLLNRLSLLSVNSDDIKIGIEATGPYSSNLLSFLQDHSFNVFLLNPLSASRFRSATSLRKTKTDKNDSRYIAKLLMNDKAVKPYRIQAYHISSLKSITRTRFRIIKSLQPCKNRFRRLVHVLFPEFPSVFSDVYGATSLQLLSRFPSAADIAKCDIRKLTNIIVSASHGKLQRPCADRLKALALASVGTYSDADALELQMTIEDILHYSSQLTRIEKKISDLMNEIDSPITSIPGIGTVLGASILSEIGDISLFSDPDKLLAFAGCEPSTYQSGKHTATNNASMVKHGSHYLRHALYCATDMAYLHSQSMHDYIERKRSQGKHFYVAMSHGIKKLVRIIFAVLSRNITYTEPA